MDRFPLRLLAITLLALPAAEVVRGADDAPKPRELKTIRALLVIDTNTNLTQSVEQDRKNMMVLLEEHVPADRRKIDVLDGKRVTREEILKYYKNLKTGPDEALLFFYAGHEAIDEKLGQCLQPQMGKTPLVPRAEVRKAMEQKGAGLVVLLTDCCSTQLRTKPKAKPREPLTKVVLHPVLRCLFFEHRGTADLTATEDGASSYGDDQHGGVFTNALVSLLEGDLKSLDDNRTGFISWKEFFPLLSRETEKQFKDFAIRARAQGEQVDQKTQRPRSFALPDAPAADETKSYAVVSLRNTSGQTVQYRYRWSGEKEWKKGTLAEKGQVVHDLALAEGAKLPDLEIEAETAGDKGKSALKAARWSGKGRPAYKDGQEYNISAK